MIKRDPPALLLFWRWPGLRRWSRSVLPDRVRHRERAHSASRALGPDFVPLAWRTSVQSVHCAGLW